MSLVEIVKAWFSGQSNQQPPLIWQSNWSSALAENVAFYRNLPSAEKVVFEQRCSQFIHTTSVEGGVEVEVDDLDRLLVAASAVIPVWKFKGWHYFNLQCVYLLPASFNEKFECGKPDSWCTGMVGHGPMKGKMALSKPALHQGFNISKDKKNVGIHEFVHLIDMADGTCDGYPERLREYQYALPWFELVHNKVGEINAKKNNINDYATTNSAEFLAVCSEYFFERPQMLQRKHPQIYDALETMYKMDAQEILGMNV